MIDFEEILKNNYNKYVVCSTIKQRTRILTILNKMNVSINPRTLRGEEIDYYPNLTIDYSFVCGCRSDPSSEFGIVDYNRISECDFINIFVKNKFDIYGNGIFNK